ncbi:MAG: DUF1269 domain-containing protein [Roseiflexaceae bacterium]|nr:DUF1269 domain-containing protein [Roseiflexaceae bacterium]
MSDLIALTFDSSDDAQRARTTLGQLQRDGQISLYDAVTITKDADGKLRIQNEIDRDVKIGTAVGGVIGLLFSFALPIVGLAIGAAGGALVGKTLDRDIDKQFINEVGAAIAPGESALCVLVRDGENDMLRAAFAPMQGRIFQTTLDPDLEQQLRDALKA